MKNLENYGVQVLDAREIKEIDGGGIISDLVHAFICSCNWGSSNMENGTGLIAGQKW